MRTYSPLLKSYLILAIITSTAFASHYSKTAGERRAEDLGSITDGIIFRPKRVENDSTRSVLGTVNKYLWQAAIDVIKFAPLTSVDSNSGIIITDWYSPKEKHNYNFKINIFITGDVISPSSIEVKIFQQKFQQGKWINVQDSSNLASILEEKILYKARNLHISSKK